MTSERWKKVEELFEAALEHAPAERGRFLKDACGSDEGLRSQVETLLDSLDQAGTFMDEPIFGASISELDFEQESSIIGTRLGAYELVSQLGRGGMGSVYLARRADDEFQKQVAIKLIRRGMDTDFIIRRFRNERQILADLDHPHIGRLLDGGTTQDGLPYFVMEYVAGQPLYEYCDEHELTISARLRLFRKVCAAVHYAHQHMVIHRDLKPGNILVTNEGVPKLLDFGIAKLVNPDSVSHALPTTGSVRLMTLEYASPEQVLGETVTVASDLYSLGVLLYELLTDHRPYRLIERSVLELTRAICDVEPERPSVVVNLIEIVTVDGQPIEITPETVSKERNTTPDQLKRQLAGSLDNIVLKALRKESEKRYGTVEEFSEDLRRYLEGFPVAAPSQFPSPPSFEVDTADPAFTRSIAVLPFNVLRAEEKTDEFLGMGMADAIITKLSNIRRILVRPTSAIIKYFDGDHNVIAAGQELNVGYILDGRIQRVGERVRVTVQLMRVSDAMPVWATKLDEHFTDMFTVEDSISEQVAQALVPRLTGEERELLLRRETQNANAYQSYLKGRYFWNRFTDEDFRKALKQFCEAIRLDPHYALPYVGIADYYNWAAIYSIGAPGDYFPQAKQAATQALELDESLAEAHAALAFTTLLYDWDWDRAEKGFKRALELNSNYGPAHQWYANLLTALGRFDEAIDEIKRAQEINPLSLMDVAIGGWIYYQSRQYENGAAELERALEMDRNFANFYTILGLNYERLGRSDEAIEMLQKGQKAMGGSLLPLGSLGFALAKAGKREEAQEVAERLKRLSEEGYVSPYYLALVYTGLGDREAAFTWLERAFEFRDDWLIWLATEPKLDELRGDPRFENLRERIGLPCLHPGVAELQQINEANTTADAAEAVAVSHVTAAPKVDLRPEARDERATKRWPVRPLSVAATALIALLAIFVVYELIWRRAGNERFLTSKVTKLTTTGNVNNAALSPDGKYAVYAVDESGKQGLWIRQIAISNSIRIVPPAAVEYRGLTFSNEGAFVYYVAYEPNGKDGNLYQVPAFGGSVREVKKDVDSPISFSPDGKRYAFVRSNADRSEDALVIADQSNGKEEQVALRKYPDHFSFSTAPAWSPDSNLIACVTITADDNGFFAKLTGVHLSDRGETLLSTDRWLDIAQVGWLPDGSGLLITAQNESSAFQLLWQVGYPSLRARKITSDLSDYRAVSTSSNPGFFLSVQRQTLTSIWVAPKGAIDQARQITSGAGRFFDLSWTSDGSILYASDASGSADLWEMKADGTDQKQVTAGVGRNYAPVASPDGQSVLFHSNRSGNWQIWKMARDGSTAVQMTSGKEESNWPVVSPDGRWLFYQRTGAGTSTIWKLPIEGGTPVQLTFTLSMRPTISPDGKLFAYWHKENKSDAPWRIAISSVDDGAMQKLIDVPQSLATANSVLHWTADGRGILFIDFRNGVTNLMEESIDGGASKALTNFTQEQFYSFDLSGDGRLVLSRGLRTNDAVLISEGQ